MDGGRPVPAIDEGRLDAPATVSRAADAVRRAAARIVAVPLDDLHDMGLARARQAALALMRRTADELIFIDCPGDWLPTERASAVPGGISVEAGSLIKDPATLRRRGRHDAALQLDDALRRGLTASVWMPNGGSTGLTTFLRQVVPDVLVLPGMVTRWGRSADPLPAETVHRIESLIPVRITILLCDLRGVRWLRRLGADALATGLPPGEPAESRSL
jgi:hypothetical protein